MLSYGPLLAGQFSDRNLSHCATVLLGAGPLVNLNFKKTKDTCDSCLQTFQWNALRAVMGSAKTFSLNIKIPT